MPGIQKEAVVVDFDAAVDQALAKMPSQDAGADDAPAEGSREASEPGAPALRSLRSAEDEDASADAGDPVAARLKERLAADDRAQQAAATHDERRHLERGKRYAEFLDECERDPLVRDLNLARWDPDARRRVMDRWEQEEAPAPARGAARPAKDDPLADYDERDRTAISRLLEQRDQMWEQRLAKEFAPFREQAAAQEAAREIQVLAAEAPDWKDWAKPEELKAVRAEFPGLSLTAAYRIVSQPKIRASINKADRQMATVRNVIERARPAESLPKRHVKVEKPAMNYDEAFDQALARVKAASAGSTPGR